MLILHGETITASRQFLFETLQKYKQTGVQIIRFEAKQLSVAELELALRSQDLFVTQAVVCIEGLHSLPKSTRKNELIALLTTPTEHTVILWEKRLLTKTMLKPFTNAEVRVFTTSSALFSWLETLGTTQITPQKKVALLHEAVQKDGEYLCFIMLARQVRLLLQVKDGGIPKGPPFMLAKLKKQAQQFTLTNLLELHRQLVKLDEKTKTSGSLLGLAAELDLLTVTV